MPRRWFEAPGGAGKDGGGPCKSDCTTIGIVALSHPVIGIAQGLFACDENRVSGTDAPRVSRPVAAKRRWAGRAATIQEEMK